MEIIKLIGVIIAISVLGCVNQKKEAKDFNHKKVIDTITKIEINIAPKNKSNVSGTIVFIEEEGMVSMEANLIGLTEGVHAIHINEKSDCTSFDGKFIGSHRNPTMESDAKWKVKERYHKGDIGNFKADSNGNGHITFATNDWCIGCDDDKKNIVGKAIIIYQGIDDYTSQPFGTSESIVICGGIIQ
ncbi:superoxide dismutase family protein [Aquimarina longa]|uniref:superoxide dismutase family protein n=1 Tax=Aquimarina longa TaxID=1080221 RepID=UPI0007839E5A|nr:superoxide dismutase family protein [Aquimarina longa]